MSDPAVIVDGVHVTYQIAGGGRRLRSLVARREAGRRPRQVHAVRGVTIEAEEGETVGLIGRNGSGKSSLLRAVAGLLPVTAGAIHAVEHPTLLGVGAALKPDSTGRQNVLLGASAMGLGRSEIQERMEEILEFAGLEDAAEQPFGTYSSGMKARLQFAVATATRPRVLMIDEALAVGDEEFRERSQERIRELLNGASTVFLVSHALLEIERRCDRVLWLEQGEQVQWGPAEDVVNAYREHMAARRAASRAAPGTAQPAASRAHAPKAPSPDRHETRSPEPPPSRHAWASAREAVDQHLVELEAENQRLRALLARAAFEAPLLEAGPFFVGGSNPRDLRTVAGLLGRHPDVEPIPTQLRFHAVDGGLRAVLDERLSPEQFADRVRGRHFERGGVSDGPPKGLQLISHARDLSRAERQLIAMAERDLLGALRTYVHLLVDPYANGRGAVTWVEATPDNDGVADCLVAVFPRARVINVVRDGRDVAAEVVSQPWGPSSAEEALEWWADRTRKAHQAMVAGDSDRVIVVRYEDLLSSDERAAAAAVLERAGLSDEGGASSWFAAQVHGRSTAIGSWRTTFPGDLGVEVHTSYARHYEALEAEGVTCLPASPDEVDELSESRGVRASDTA